MSIDINVIVEKYKPGDLAMTCTADGLAWMVEILRVKRKGYEARLTRMARTSLRELYKVECREPSRKEILDENRIHPLNCTYGFVRFKDIIRLRLDNVDFISIGMWQEFRRKEEAIRSQRESYSLETNFI